VCAILKLNRYPKEIAIGLMVFASFRLIVHIGIAEVCCFQCSYICKGVIAYIQTIFIHVIKYRSQRLD